MPRSVQLVAYHPEWHSLYQREAEQILHALQPELLAIHHIGSTSIPGIFAKPIIDILVEVRQIERVDIYNEAMSALGYEARGEYGLPGRRYFCKRTGEVHTHHVHIYQRGHPDIPRHLAFRDYLRAHPAQAQRYSQLKQELAALHPADVDAYQDGKSGLIQELEQNALDWQLTLHKESLNMIHTDFHEARIPDGFAWLNPPLQYRFEHGLVVYPQAKSDFWQTTHYGFRNDNGHCLMTGITGDFSLETRVNFSPQHQYDQCGLVVRLDSQNWIKCSTEFEDEQVSRLGSVVTNLGFSDWATQDVSSALKAISYRISRKGSDFLIEHSTTGEAWQQMRIAHLHTVQEKVSAGIYACSPIAAGFHCRFESIKIGESKWR
jgi:uncharacterized protein